MVSPQGKPFFSLGVCCVNMGTPREKYDPHKPGYAAWRRHADSAAWADTTLERLRTWGFTTISGWSDYAALRGSRQMDRAFIPVLHLGASSGAPWFDMWDPAVIRTMDRVAREQILPVRDDPHLLGYYTDNEMGWWNGALFKLTLQQKPESGQRRRLVKLLREQYHDDWAALLKDFEPEGPKTFAQLDKGGMLYLRPGGHGIRVMRQFLGIAARRYYQLVQQTIRRYDRRGLVLGDRYQSFYYPELPRAAAPFVDAISTNLNANWNDGMFARFYLDTLHGLTHKPIIASEFYMTAMENQSGNRNDSSGFPVVASQQERAAGFRNTLAALARTPYVIGADWFQYYDEPTFGREDGENYDMGLVDIDDRPYPELTGAATSLDLVRLHTLPPPRSADASAGVPPAPPRPLADLRPLEIMRSWDRERGFVRPTARLPLADLYVCWAPDALYLGIEAIDTPEAAYYRDGQIPDVDRMEWSVRLGSLITVIRVRLGAGRAASVDNRDVTAAGPSAAGSGRAAAIMKLPASLLRKVRLRAGDRIQLSSTLVSHARAYRTEWTGQFRLAQPGGSVGESREGSPSTDPAR
jgi:hypothetical protein